MTTEQATDVRCLRCGRPIWYDMWTGWTHHDAYSFWDRFFIWHIARRT